MGPQGPHGHEKIFDLEKEFLEKNFVCDDEFYFVGKQHHVLDQASTSFFI